VVAHSDIHRFWGNFRLAGLPSTIVERDAKNNQTSIGIGSCVVVSDHHWKGLSDGVACQFSDLSFVAPDRLVQARTSPPSGRPQLIPPADQLLPRIVHRLGACLGPIKKKGCDSSNDSVPAFTARCTRSLGSEQSTSPTLIFPRLSFSSIAELNCRQVEALIQV
jgi:hypothetical protein